MGCRIAACARSSFDPSADGLRMSGVIKASGTELVEVRAALGGMARYSNLMKDPAV